MHIVDRIFDALGEATVIARETGDPVQTVHSWKAKGNVPHWRRQAVLEAAKRRKAELDADCLTYLASVERAPKKPPVPRKRRRKPAQPEQAAA